MTLAVSWRGWRIGVFPMWRFTISDHEYWRRYCCGCVYVLRGHQTEKGAEA